MRDDSASCDHSCVGVPWRSVWLGGRTSARRERIVLGTHVLVMSDAEYYILDTRQVVGNCAYWWRPNGQGYTCDLGDAGLYTLAEARSHRETDVPVHRDIARASAVTHVRIERLWDNDDLRPSLDAALDYRMGNRDGSIDGDLSESELQLALEVNPFDGDYGPRGLVILRDSIVTAAHEHRCSQCKGEIRKGLRHRSRVERTDEDGLTNYRWCHECTRGHVGYPYGPEKKHL